MGNVFAAFPALVERLGLRIEHLVHVGAHLGEEVPYYRAAGVKIVTLVEPNPDLAERLRAEHPPEAVYGMACGRVPGTATLHIPRRTNMATLATPQRADGRTRTVEVDVVPLAMIQAAQKVPPDAAVIDAQGRELDVLAGARLADLALVVVETCTVPDPTMAAPYEAVSAFMAAAGFAEADRWTRDQDWVARWARGRASSTGGEVRDVAYLKEA